MNAEFTIALKAAMRLQQFMLEMSTGHPMSKVNAQSTLRQMQTEHANIAVFLASIARRLDNEP